MITLAETDADRARVQALFAGTFHDIADNAVPTRDVDDMFDPLVAQVIDSDGELIAAALTCRPEALAGAARIPAAAFAASPRTAALPRLLNRIRELDLVAVVPDARRRGLGGDLLAFLEASLRDSGCRIWFGNVTTDLDTAALRRFYTRHGFTVLADGQPLPPFFGQTVWVPRRARPPAFYFYKQLTA